MADRARLPRRRRAHAGGQHRGPIDRVDERRGLGPGGLLARAAPAAGGWPATRSSPPRWCCARAACASPRRPTPRPTRCCCSASRPCAAEADAPHRAAHARPPGRHRAPMCPRPGPTRPGRSSRACCWPDDRRSRWSRRSTSATSSCGSCPSGRRCGASRSATPSTASRSIVTCARRRPTPSALVDRVARPDLLVIGALLHDIGKGYPGDHTEVGIEVVRSIGERMGFVRRRHHRPPGHGAPPPAAARRGHPARPVRRGHDPLRGRPHRPRSTCCGCWAR